MELNKKKKKKVQRVTKPYLRGTAIDKTTFGASLKIFFSTLFMTIAYMLVCSLMTWESMFLRITINPTPSSLASILPMIKPSGSGEHT